MLQRLVLGDRDGAAVAEFRGGALTAQRAVIADLRIELDDRAERDRLHTILPRRPSTSSTRVLLMYPRSMRRSSIVSACRCKSVRNEGMASSSGRFAGVMAHARINPRSTSAAMCRLKPINR